VCFCICLDEYQAACRNEFRNDRSQSLQEHDSGCVEFNASPRIDTSRSLSFPDEDTAVKTCSTASNNVCLPVDCRQSDSLSLRGMIGIADQNATHSQSHVAVIHNEAGSIAVTGVEHVETVETDGPQPDTSSSKSSSHDTVIHNETNSSLMFSSTVETDGPQPGNSSSKSSSHVALVHNETNSSILFSSTVETDGPQPGNSSSKPSRQVAVLLPTRTVSANDSGFVEQDGTVSPLIPLVKSMRIPSSGGTASAHRRSVENHSSSVTLRNYQFELAEPGCQGSNCIICAPTGSGKTYTAGYICKMRRDKAVEQHRRFKCLFVVCIRNLISQQQDALCRIMPESGVVCGVDDKLLLSEYFKQFDVVVATAQVCLELGLWILAIT